MSECLCLSVSVCMYVCVCLSVRMCTREYLNTVTRDFRIEKQTVEVGK